MHYARPDRSSHVASMGLRLKVYEWGNVEAPPLLLLHGAMDQARSWDLVAGTLSKDWRVIAPDLRGHGDSDWAPGGAYDYYFHTFDLHRVIEQLGLGATPIIAHSMGGNITLRYAGLFPHAFERIVAIEGLGPPPKRRADGAIMNFVELAQAWIAEQSRIEAHDTKGYDTIDQAIERLRRMNPSLPDEMAAHLAAHALKRLPSGRLTWKFDPAVRAFAPVDYPKQELHGLWARIDCPVLLVGGAKSWHSSPLVDGRAAPFRQAEVVMLENAGHWAHHDQPELFLRSVKDFLSRNIARSEPRDATATA